MISPLRIALTGLLLLAALFPAAAQSPTPVPKLDPTRLIGTWYVIARYPGKRELPCIADEMVLYALGDKPDSIQIVTACQTSQSNSDAWNSKGTLSTSGDGRLRLKRFWPFTSPYWFLALAPDYSWALVGTPNRKSLWILSRSISLPSATLAGIEAQASAQGFNTASLLHVPQN